MRRSWMMAMLLVGGILPVSAPEAVAQPKPALTEPFAVLGYLPDYRVAAFQVDTAQWLTDLVYFAAEPGASGALNLDPLKPATLALLRQAKQKHKVRLHLCLGGGNLSQGFPALAKTESTRNRLAAETTDFCVKHGFDGIVVDWEHPETDAELQGHALLLQALRQRLQPHRLRLAIAMAAWQRILPESIAAVDLVHLMSYDAAGRHATYEAAVKDLDRLRKKGIPAEKLYLGIPFYGRDVNQRDKVLTYAEIVRKYQPAANVDEIDGMYFNGLHTVERKTRLAQTSGLAGVMVWEIGQDAPGTAALLPAIRRMVK